jgi:hypothetical protein
MPPFHDAAAPEEAKTAKAKDWLSMILGKVMGR